MHNPEVSLLTCHNPNKKGSPETRDFRAYAGRPKRDVAPRRDSAWKREHSRKRNPVRGLAIGASEGVGLRMGARENPGVTNFATPGFKWRGQDSNLRPRGYEPRELPGCSTPRYVSLLRQVLIGLQVPGIVTGKPLSIQGRNPPLTLSVQPALLARLISSCCVEVEP